MPQQSQMNFTCNQSDTFRSAAFMLSSFLQTFLLFIPISILYFTWHTLHTNIQPLQNQPGEWIMVIYFMVLKICYDIFQQYLDGGNGSMWLNDISINQCCIPVTLVLTLLFPPHQSSPAVRGEPAWWQTSQGNWPEPVAEFCWSDVPPRARSNRSLAGCGRPQQNREGSQWRWSAWYASFQAPPGFLNLEKNAEKILMLNNP